MKRSGMLFVLIGLCMSLLGCSKNDGSDGPDGSDLRGVLLYDAGEHTYQLDLGSNTKSIYFNRNSYSLNGWDVSWDGKLRLESEIITGETDKVQFRLVNTENNSVVKDFVYGNPHDEDRQITGLLSPDKSLILIQPDFNHGIVIIDTDGNVKKHLPVVNNTELTLGDEAIWLPNNSILFTFGKNLLKTDPPYADITLVKEIDGRDWGNIHASADGRKISLRIDKHIYLMDADGKNQVQVTESDGQEREAVFSPDGRHLLVAADYYPGTFHSGTWDLNIIPADGNSYKVGNNPGSGVVVIRPNGEENVEVATNWMLWR